MNGADSLCDALLATGIDTCFANPGTSEMHFVASLDRKPAMRCILALFEGVATGAADGFGRMADRPAATLLHTGPGLANGLANLHNAKRARSPIVNVVGDHASHHLPFDAPLTSDIDGWRVEVEAGDVCVRERLRQHDSGRAVPTPHIGDRATGREPVGAGPGGGRLPPVAHRPRRPAGPRGPLTPGTGRAS